MAQFTVAGVCYADMTTGQSDLRNSSVEVPSFLVFVAFTTEAVTDRLLGI